MKSDTTNVVLDHNIAKNIADALNKSIETDVSCIVCNEPSVKGRGIHLVPADCSKEYGGDGKDSRVIVYGICIDCASKKGASDTVKESIKRRIYSASCSYASCSNSLKFDN